MTQLYILQLNQQMSLTLALIKTSNDLILIDTGLPNSISEINEQMLINGFSITELTKIIITHHDFDHIGSLRAIQEACPQVDVFSSQFDIPYIEGDLPSLRIQKAIELKKHQSPIEQKQTDASINHLNKIQHGINIKPLQLNAPLMEDVIIVDTKGHMRGHISVYLPSLKTLITGDALVKKEGVLCLPEIKYTLDYPQALTSLQSLQQYDINCFICYYGGTVMIEINDWLQKQSLVPII